MGVARDVLIIVVAVAVWLGAIFGVTKRNVRSEQRRSEKARRAAAAPGARPDK